MIINLRGLKESGTAMAIPVNLFVGIYLTNTNNLVELGSW